MKTLKLLVLASTLLGLTACEITGPSAKVEPPKVKVSGDVVKVEGEKGNNNGNNGGNFCPPGQAKKGKCKS